MFWFIAITHAAFAIILLGNLAYLQRRNGRQTPSPLPSVSILVPARNEAHNLIRLLPSLLDQDYPELEIIVYDDGSEDATWEIMQAHDDDRLCTLRGDGPPPGWVGKVHALFQASRQAQNDLFLFLDADARLEDARALRRLVARYTENVGPDRVLSGFTRLRGAAPLLVSIVPNALLTGLPWPLVPRSASPSLAALNGQCWMIAADAYRRHQPHREVAGEVLEDVEIGRYLKTKDLFPVMIDVQKEVSIFMYGSYPDAWRGFRKNAYLLFGGAPLPFAALFLLFGASFVAAPFTSPWLLGSLYALKLTTDRCSGYPLWVSLLAPLSYLLAWILQADSALHHWHQRVDWKGRQVGGGPAPRSPESHISENA